MNETTELHKLFDDYLSEALQGESPRKQALLKALVPMAMDGLQANMFQGGSASVAAIRLVFEIMGLPAKGQKPRVQLPEIST